MAEPAAKPPRKKGSAGLVSVLIIGAFFPPTSILILAGLIPTYVAWLTDSTKGKLTAITVGSFNLAALMPLLMRLWDKGNSVSTTISLLFSPFSWILILAGAGVGWMLTQVLPLMVVGFITARDKAKLDKIRSRQKALTDDWGIAITEVNTPAKRR